MPAIAVRRERVEQLLDAHPGSRIVLVRGPAGAGKTVLVSQWLQGRDDRSVWLTVDAAHDDPALLLRHLILAAEQLAPGPGRAGPNQAGPGPRAGPAVDDGILRDVLGAAARRPGAPLAVVLDGADRLQDPRSRNLVARLVDHPPEGVRLVLVARGKPRLGVERARMRGDLTEVGPLDLRFQRPEIEALVATWTGGPIDVGQLEQATLGWAAGLRLVELRTGPGPGSGELHEPTAVAGEYVSEELIDGSPPDLRRFLQVTCWLPVLTPSLCAAVADRLATRPSLTLPEVEALPLLPIASRPGAFRYPPILTHALQQEYRRRDAHAARSALCRAAEACRRTGELVTATELFLRAGRTEEAAEACADLAALDESHLRRVDELLRRHTDLVPTTVRWLPWRIRAAVVAGHIDEATVLLRHADRHHPPAVAPPGTSDDRSLVVARAVVAEHGGDVATLLACADELVGTGRPAAAGCSLTELRAHGWRVRAYAWSGDLRRARGALRAVEAAGGGASSGPAALAVDLARAWVAWFEGEITLLDDVVAAIERRQPIDHGAEVALLAGAALRERNRLGAAAARLQEASTHPHNVVAALATSELARCRRAAGATMHALELVVPMRSACPGLPAAVDAHLRTTEARLRLDQDDVGGAYAIVRAAQPGVDALLLAARVALHQTPGRAAELLASIASGSRRQAVEKLLLRAQLRGVERVEASMALLKAVADGEPLGLIRTFLDEGPEVCRRIPELALESADRPVGRIAALACQELALAPTPEQAPPVEQLTTRELAVLRMLPLRMSNREMATQMYISVNTLKTHVRAIYRKLDVPDRSAAVRRAKALELV